MDLHAWVDLGLKKDHGRLLKFSSCSNTRKKYFIFLAVNE
jgi:hypothetical protein